MNVLVLLNNLQAKKYSCNAYSKLNILNHNSISHLFCIDVEKVICKQYAIILDKLVPFVTILNKKFATIANNESRNYIAYARNNKGYWVKYNDINIETSIAKKVNRCFSINAALLLYVKYDNTL